jgi:hypothetical protein
MSFAKFTTSHSHAFGGERSLELLARLVEAEIPEG